MKKVVCICLMAACIFCGYSKSRIKFDSKNAVKDTGKVAMKDVSAVDLVADMNTGWNLGNTLDSTASKTLSSETSWGVPKTTKAMIDGIADYGIKTIRIPVSWNNHIIDSNYTIDPAWMSRVKEIVDWAIGDGMYVIIDTHHDNFGTSVGLRPGHGYYPNTENYEESSNYFTNVWSQISLAFNNGYDEHLVFETMNEPRLRGTEVEWSYSSGNEKNLDALKTINRLNQDCVDVIRKSGGNNAKRFIMMPGYAATPVSVLSDDFVLPKDKVPGRLIVSVHMYTPYAFAGQSPGAKAFLPKMQNDFVSVFKKLNEKFVKNGVGVIIGEYGAVNKNNTEERVKYFTSYIKFAKQYGLCPVLWDNGKWKVAEDSNNYSEKFGYYNRKEQTWYFPEIAETLIQ